MDHVRLPSGLHRGRDARGVRVDLGLSIVGLVISARAALIPLFMKQIHASRNMQILSPERRRSRRSTGQDRDPESRQKMTQETMEFLPPLRDQSASSCLPILAQSPIFGLFRVLNGLQSIADGKRDGIGSDHPRRRESGRAAMIFGAQLSGQVHWCLRTTNTKIVTIVLDHLDVGHDVHHPAP